MHQVEGYVWCDVCGAVHEATEDPYNYGPLPPGQAPECTVSDWRKLWLGRAYDGEFEEAERTDAKA